MHRNCSKFKKQTNLLTNDKETAVKENDLEELYISIKDNCKCKIRVKALNTLVFFFF